LTSWIRGLEEVAANIDDAPDLPFRGIYWAGGDRQSC